MIRSITPKVLKNDEHSHGFVVNTKFSKRYIRNRSRESHEAPASVEDKKSEVKKAIVTPHAQDSASKSVGVGTSIISSGEALGSVLQEFLRQVTLYKMHETLWQRYEAEF